MRPPSATLHFLCAILTFLFLALTVPVSPLAAAGVGSVAIDPGQERTIDVGVARIDITPQWPIRLAGYGARTGESEGVLQKLYAKALAFGSDEESPSILLTVDLIAVPAHVTRQVAEAISERIEFDPARLAIHASHTHTGPEVGNLLNHFREPLPPDHLARINNYLEELVEKLGRVALEALERREPALVSRGEGVVRFAVNRRVLDENGRWSGFGVVPDGPVDHSLPVLRITDPNGGLRAILVSYACHGTTLGGEINSIHGDWIGDAQRQIERDHPGVTALVAVGAGADANPEPRGSVEHTAMHGREIADEVNRLLQKDLKPVTETPVAGRMVVRLPYAEQPGTQELYAYTRESGAKAYYGRLALDRLARGMPPPEYLEYPVQTWTFGDQLAMVFLAGEVVVDYALRLKREFDPDRIWINAYVNEVPGYIPSTRILEERGYEAESSMYSYDHPSPFSKQVEEIIIDAVHQLLPESYRVSGGE